MTEFIDDFNKHAESLRLRAEAENRLDYNVAGSDVVIGRQRKHLPKDEIDPATGKKKRSAVEEILHRTLQELLANNPAYKLAHENLISSVRSAQSTAQTTLQRIEQALADKEALWNEKLSMAARLPDGTSVFKDEHGVVQTLDGKTITPEQAAKIKWRGDEPTLEEMLLLQQDIFNLKASRDELLGIETELGEIYNRNNVDDKPPTPEDMKRDTDRADELEQRVLEIETNAKAELGSNENTVSRDEVALESVSTEITPDINFGSKP